ncbi:MAG: 23S rRNA (uridine(2552)-2'-O)-methyltransferase RlmE [Pseudomonadota bacterium]
MAKRSKSSHRWLNEHERDPYVQRARQAGWRSRAVYKLEELDQRNNLFRKGMTVIDLGAAPGGWSQYAAYRLNGRGQVIALDILPMDALAGVEVLQADFREPEGLAALEAALGGGRADLVMSDMAPNISGIAGVDQPRGMYLAELALELCTAALIAGGSFVCKLFHGEGFDAFVKLSRARFEQVSVKKPAASRPRSREVYLVARNYQV